MPGDFVRYAPEMERLDPDLDRLLEQIIGFWETLVRESPAVEGSGRAVRGAHAKTFGVVRAEVQILRNVPPAYAQGIYAQPGRHGALIRRIYSASAKMRRTLNHQPHTEPANADEVLSYPVSA